MKSKLGRTVLNLIGSTPIVRLDRMVKKDGAEIWAKLEGFNPAGSVKDRICLSMIEAAETDGLIKPGDTVIEPTGGNTGVSLAFVCAAKGYKLVLIMPDNVGKERKKLLIAFGAKLVLTPTSEGMRGSAEKAEELARKEGYFMLHQFKNPANPEAHRKFTAKEILDQMGKDLDAFVCGVGTGGTVTGVGEVLKRANPKTKIIAVEPANSPVLSGGKPGTHKIYGIGPGFIPEVLNVDILDEIVTVDDEEAISTTKRLAWEEGLLVGISSGAAIEAALKVSKNLGRGKKILVILPDNGERYLSMDIFNHLNRFF